MKLAAQFDELAAYADIPPQITDALIRLLYISEDSENVITIDRLEPSFQRWRSIRNDITEFPHGPEKLNELATLQPFAELLLVYARNRQITHLCRYLLSDDEATRESLARLDAARAKSATTSKA